MAKVFPQRLSLIAKNDVVQPQTEYIENRYHFSRQAVKSGEVKLIYYPTELMLADALTKASVKAVSACKLKEAQPLNQLSQARADPEDAIQHSDSFS